MDNKYYLKVCYDLAKHSPDSSNQNAAIIVDRNNGIILSTGINTFHESIKWDQEKIKDRDWKLFHIEHAERNAIYPMAKYGVKTFGQVMICPWFACGDCARAILFSGIKKVVGHKERMDATAERWKASVEAGLKILTDGGVELEFYSGKINADPIIVNGEYWHP